MAQTFVEYPANGTDYSVPFDYLSKQYVKVFIDEVETTDFSFVNAGTIRLGTDPGTGPIVKVQRVTPRDTRLVDFVDGSVLTETELDTSTIQLLHVVQEAYDNLGAEARDAIAADKADTEQFRDDAFEWATRAEDNQFTDSAGQTGYSAFHWKKKAEAEKSVAETARTAAQAARDKASQWSDEAEDVEVETGRYSAFHWAQKAATFNPADYVDLTSDQTIGGKKTFDANTIVITGLTPRVELFDNTDASSGNIQLYNQNANFKIYQDLNSDGDWITGFAVNRDGTVVVTNDITGPNNYSISNQSGEQVQFDETTHEVRVGARGSSIALRVRGGTGETDFQADGPRAGQGNIVTPWVNTGFVESMNEGGSASSGIAIGNDNPFTQSDEIGFVTNGSLRGKWDSGGGFSIGYARIRPSYDVLRITDAHGVDVAQFTDSTDPTALPGDLHVVTRARGDARYIRNNGEDTTNPGFIQLGNTLICWGHTSYGDYKTVNFPRSFSAKPTVTMTCERDDTGTINYDLVIQNLTNTSFDMIIASTKPSRVHWIAIGPA